MRKRAADPVEVYFLTDPLCPWSWAMESAVSSMGGVTDVHYRSVMVGWLPNLALKPASQAKAEWADAAKTGARIDPAYWDRVAPSTSLIAAAAVKSASFQALAKGEEYLLAVRRSVFARGEDPTSTEILLSLARDVGLKPDLFREDLGVGRYTKEEVVTAIEPDRAVSDCVEWFGRRKMLRAWTTLAEDLANAERQGLTSPSLHLIHGRKESIVRGLATSRQIEDALKTVR